MEKQETGNINLVYDRIFKEHFGKNSIIFDKYKTIYNLSIATKKCSVSKKLYEYCLRKKFFVLLLIYNNEGKVYLDRNMSDILSWGLPGGSIRDNETINQALNRIAKNVDKSIQLANVEPVCSIKNIFNYKEEQYVHEGMGFIARIRNPKEIDNDKLPGSFIEVNEEEVDFVNRMASKKVIEVFKKRFKTIQTQTNNCFQDDEINTNEQYKQRYKFHNSVVKKFILTNKRKRKAEFSKIIEELIGNPESLIDVSCGEDKFIFELGRKKEIPLVVGNDISWSQVELLNSKYQEVIFTNHNAATLPFKNKSFDVSYCSNTLHHMPNKRTLKNLLLSMEKISKKIIIVEIEDPKITGGFAKSLNKNWYINFLKDVGGAYLSKEQFETIIKDTFNEKYNIEYRFFKNIMGVYMIAVIEEKEF